MTTFAAITQQLHNPDKATRRAGYIDDKRSKLEYFVKKVMGQ